MKQCTKQHRKQPKTLVPKMIECINRSEYANTVSSDAFNIGCINNKSSASNNIKNNRIDFQINRKYQQHFKQQQSSQFQLQVWQ